MQLMSRSISIAVINITDMVAEVLLERMSDYVSGWNARVSLFDDVADASETALFCGKATRVQNLDEINFALIDIAFICGDAGDNIVESATQNACRVIDLRRTSRAGLSIVAGVNDKQTLSQQHLRSPHPVTVCLAPVLATVSAMAGVQRINVTAMMSASEAGNAGIKALAAQTARLLNGQPVASDVFGSQLAFNVVAPAPSDIAAAQTDIVSDLRGVCALPELSAGALLATVSAFFGMTLAVDIELSASVSQTDIAKALRKLPETVVASGKKRLPTVVDQAAGEVQMHVALLPDVVAPGSAKSHLLRLWIVADNIHRGRVFNALAIADYLVSHPA